MTCNHTTAYFDPSKRTVATFDASPFGLGAALTQVDQNGQEHVVAYASRILGDVERRYSQTEREALAIVWGCERFYLYLYGADFEIVTDHKPLELIFNNPNSKPPARIQRWALRLQAYTFTVKYKPGPTNIADYLSRHPLPSQPQRERLIAEERSKSSTHYLGDKNRFDVSSKGPTKGLCSKRRICFYRLGSE